MICDIEFGSICCHVHACTSGIKQTADNRRTTGRQQTIDGQAQLLNQRILKSHDRDIKRSLQWK